MLLGEILVAQQLVASQNDVVQAIQSQQEKGGRLGSTLMHLGLASHDAIATGLSKQMGVPAALTKHFKNIDNQAIKKLSVDLADQYKVVPFAFASIGEVRRLVICCRDPLDPQMLKHITSFTAMDIYPVVAPERSVFSMLASCFNLEHAPIYQKEAPSPKKESVQNESKSHGFQLAMLDDEFVNKSTPKYNALPAKDSTPPSKKPILDQKQKHNHSTSPEVPLLSLEDAKDTIKQASSRDEIVDTLFAYLKTFADSAVLLQIKDDLALGYKGYGGKFDATSVQSIVLPLSAESIVAVGVSENRDVFQSKKKKVNNVEARFLNFFSEEYIFRGCVPISIQNRVVMIIYLHGSDLGAHKDELLELKEVFSKSILRLIKESKK